MSYKVIHAFTDLQDFNHIYRVGDIFPRSGMKVSDERLSELSSNKNKQKKALIAREKSDFSQYMNVPEELPFVDVPQETRYTKTGINRLSTAELREIAKQNGIDNAETITGAELKKILIDMFGL